MGGHEFESSADSKQTKECAFARACGVVAMLTGSARRPECTVGAEFFTTMVKQNPTYGANLRPSELPKTPEELELLAYAATAHIPATLCGFDCPALGGLLFIPEGLA